MTFEEDNSVFQLPISEPVASAQTFEAPKTPEAPVSSVAEAAKIVSTHEPAQIVAPVMPTEKLSDQALFDELNAVSEEVIACRNRILDNIF